MDDWFTMEQIAPDTWRLSEYRHWEETHCYLLEGGGRSLLVTELQAPGKRRMSAGDWLLGHPVTPDES